MAIFGKCKVCLAKDEHIADLKRQIELLSRIAIPNNIPTQVNYAEAMEADKLLSGSTDSIPLQEPDFSVDQLLSGTYDNDHTDRF